MGSLRLALRGACQRGDIRLIEAGGFRGIADRRGNRFIDQAVNILLCLLARCLRERLEILNRGFCPLLRLHADVREPENLRKDRRGRGRRDNDQGQCPDRADQLPAGV